NMNKQISLVIAVDFDGTIVEDAYPKIGKPKLFAFETLKRLQNDAHRLILWTYRSDIRLEEAVDFCKKNGLEFYAVNKSFPAERFDYTDIRKIRDEWFIDERDIRGFYGWGKSYQVLPNPKYNPHNPIKRKRGVFLFR